MQHFPQYREMGIPWRSLKSREKSLQSSFGLPSCITAYLLKTLKSQSVLFYSFFINTIIKYKKVFRVFIEITNIHTRKLKRDWRPSFEGLQIFNLCLQGLQEHEQQIEHIWIQQNFCFLLNIFLRLKYQKNMAPKKSKVKKRVAHPAKGIIERTICAHPMLKRVQKEVRELTKKLAKSTKNN